MDKSTKMGRKRRRNRVKQKGRTRLREQRVKVNEKFKQLTGDAEERALVDTFEALITKIAR